KMGAGIRENSIPYASFGLVWKKYGVFVCGSEEVARIIEKKIVEPTDAEDNGVSIIKPIFEEIYPYSYFRVIRSLNPTWKERGKDRDELFVKAAESAKAILLREIEITKHFIEGKKFVEKAYDDAEDKRLIILDNEYSWKEVLSKRKEPLFVIEPNFEEGQWRIVAMRDDAHSFKNRKDMPESWGGKRGEELALETGVQDAVFCHNHLFIAAARSKDGAIKMAKIAIRK
ncbi:MAG: MYG1 family protein, partial [Patescibacteria group bacterium]|nr:MYG1 family protein [Patescibacteria group bacterium]